VYIRYCALCNPRIYAIPPTAIRIQVQKTCMNNSVQFFLCDFLSSRPDLLPLQNFPLLKSPCSLAQVQTHLCQLHHVSTHSTIMFPHTLHYMKCHNDLSPLYTSLRGQHRIPSTIQHQIRLSCGCEVPIQTHKSHHQTHEAPTSFQWWFSPK
jgi:hypothetical protein